MLSPRTAARLGLTAAFIVFALCMAIIGRAAADGKRLPHRYPTDVQPAVVTPALQPTDTPALPLWQRGAEARLAKAR